MSARSIIEGVDYKTRFIPQGTEQELVELWHLARTALAGKRDSSGKHLGSDRHARMVWASGEFAKKHRVSPTAAYKDLEGLLS